MTATESVELARQRIEAERKRLAPQINKLFRDWLKTQGIQLDEDRWVLEWKPAAELPVPIDTRNEVKVP